MNEQGSKKNESKPVKVVRQGAVAASIWKRQTPNGLEYYDFSISRSWKAKTSGKEGYSPNFFASNEVELTQVVKDASAWITEQQTCLHASREAGNQADQLADVHDSLLRDR